MATKVVLKKVGTSGDSFTALNGRFTIEAERTTGGFVRGWRLKDTQTNAERFCKTRAGLRLWIEEKVSKELSTEQRDLVAAEIKMMLHCCRDTMRIRYNDRHLTVEQKKQLADPTTCRFDSRLADFGEAFGVLRALNVLGFGEFGAVNHEHTLNAWFNRLQDEVLAEEGFGTHGKCERCFAKYQRDDARPYGEIR